jgi:potassium channel subfamily K, other eukaryote
LQRPLLLHAVYLQALTTFSGGDYVPRTHLGRGLLFPFALGGILILGLVVGSIRSLVLDRGKKKMAARMTEKTRRRLVVQIEKNMLKDNVKRGRLGIDKAMCNALTLKPGDDQMHEKDRRQYEFEAMRKVQDLAANRRKYVSLCMSMFAFAFLVSQPPGFVRQSRAINVLLLEPLGLS